MLTPAELHGRQDDTQELRRELEAERALSDGMDRLVRAALERQMDIAVAASDEPARAWAQV